MSIPHSVSGVPTAAPSSFGSRCGALARSALREPLLHFLILGALLFTADHFINGGGDAAHTIFVDSAVDREARDLFKKNRGRDPNKDELYALRQVWLDNEVLYREGLALQVDKGDSTIRDRVIFKALTIIDSGLKLPPFDDQLLRAWFEAHRVKYDDPARYDFQEAVLAGGTTDDAARAFAKSLNAGTPSDVQAGLRIFKDRPHANLVQSYGDDFAQALEALPVGEWRDLPSKEGVRVVQLQAAKPANPGNYENLRGIVLKDWTDATMSQQRSAAVKNLAMKYTIKVEDIRE